GSTRYPLLICSPPTSPFFPYTTLFRSTSPRLLAAVSISSPSRRLDEDSRSRRSETFCDRLLLAWPTAASVSSVRRAIASTSAALDRKSTRLNSSHVKRSYSVCCLKKNN